MCGIVGAIAERHVANILLEGLKRLEYRGYDSSGMAVLDDDKQLIGLKSLGKVSVLEERMQQSKLDGRIGIAHTRWATHGQPSDKNAHPHHSSDTVAVVHNGIIENHIELKKELIDAGYQFSSETDSETIAHLFHRYTEQGQSNLQAALSLQEVLKGAFAVGILCKNNPEELIVIRHGSPLVIGLGLGENFIASDQLALLPVTREFIYLEDGDVATITAKKVNVFDKSGKPVERKQQSSKVTLDAADKGPYRHFMLKEIYEQPEAIASTIEGRLAEDHILSAFLGEQALSVIDKVERIKIIACGTSYHAGFVAKYWFESIAKLPCSVEIASEYRYRNPIVDKNTLFITISQSGETADTLSALKMAKQKDYLATLAICNVPESSIIRESDFVVMTRAGTEIGVASTKAFSTQVTALFLLVLLVGRRKGTIDKDIEARAVSELNLLPNQIQNILSLDNQIEEVAALFADKIHTLFLGRGELYPIALEGALKLKEISYIHAEAYPAGELKHGPLALIDKDMPVVVVAPNNELLEKLKSNLHEVKARGGQLIVFAEENSGIEPEENLIVIKMPEVNPLLHPVAYTIPLQLLSYHVALIKGTDVDQPRNLAKSVTVE